MTGDAWWKTLSKQEKMDVVRPLIEQRMTNTQITARLELSSSNMVVRVRQNIKLATPGSVVKARPRKGSEAIKEERPRTRSPYSPLASLPAHHPEPPLTTTFPHAQARERATFDDVREARLLSLILGTWRPTEEERPFRQLSSGERRKIRRQAELLKAS